MFQSPECGSRKTRTLLDCSLVKWQLEMMMLLKLMTSRRSCCKLPHRPLDSSQPRQRLLLSGDVHQNPGPATKYPCSVCTSNVTSRGVSYMCNRCSGWVHSKCSGLQNAVEYRRIKNWACSSCSSPPTGTSSRTFRIEDDLTDEITRKYAQLSIA